jgi:hypothetical protein
MQNHYLPHQYNLSNIVYDIPEVFNEGSESYRKTIKIYDTKKNKPLYIQTPELINIFGVSKKKNYSEILLPLGGIHAIVFKNFLSQLDNKILKDANINKNVWFSMTKSESEKETKRIINTKSVKFIPIIKEINHEATTTMEQSEHLDKCRDGMIKIKVTSTTIVKKDNEEISIDDLLQNNKLRIILQIYAIWVTMTPLDEEKTSFVSTFGIYLKPEIIEERPSYNLAFIEEEKIIFESDDEDDESNRNSDGESISSIEDNE